MLGAHFTAGHDFVAVVSLSTFPWGSSQELWAVWLDRDRASLLLLKDRFYSYYFYAKADVNVFSSFLLFRLCCSGGLSLS